MLTLASELGLYLMKWVLLNALILSSNLCGDGQKSAVSSGPNRNGGGNRSKSESEPNSSFGLIFPGQVYKWLHVPKILFEFESERSEFIRY